MVDGPLPALSYGLGTAGCYAYTASSRDGRAQACRGGVVWTGLTFRPSAGYQPAEVWQHFACSDHADELTARRRLLPRDRALLEGWRVQRDRWGAGPRRPTRDDPYRPPRPLAIGESAVQMFDHAQDWERNSQANDHDAGGG